MVSHVFTIPGIPIFTTVLPGRGQEVAKVTEVSPPAGAARWHD